jgi:hypothetical protein
MRILLLLGLGCVICGTAQAQVRCPPYCAATPAPRVPLGSATPQQRPPTRQQNPSGGFGSTAPMQQSQPQLQTIQNPSGGFGSSASMQQSQPQLPPMQNPSGGFVNSGSTQQQTYYQQQPNYDQQPIYYQSQPNYYQQTQQDQPTYYQSQQPVYRLTCQTQSLLCDAYQPGSCSCRSAITGGVEYGSTN